MDNRRDAPRHRSFLQGRIYFNNRRSSVDCLIRDISDTGARLAFSHTISTPDVVELFIPHKGATVRAHVQWRRGDEMGIAFLGENATASGAETAGSHDLAERVHHIEQELGRLHQVVDDLRKELRTLREMAH